VALQFIAAVALKNYQGFMSRKKKLEQPSPREKREVFIVHERLNT
jgi:hypothetical protein